MTNILKEEKALIMKKVIDLVATINTCLDGEGADDYYVEILKRPLPEDLKVSSNMGVHGVGIVDLLDEEARKFRYGSDIETI